MPPAAAAASNGHGAAGVHPPPPPPATAPAHSSTAATAPAHSSTAGGDLLAPFAEPGFDAVGWINRAVRGKPAEESLERFLAELEMRLQLGSEEIEAGLADVSSAALRRVPFAQHEVARLRGDVAALQAAARSLLTSVASDAQAAASAAAPLAALHTARSNMEAGCATLREAAELSGAFRRVEEVFAAGDLPRVAEMLRSMARSLALVGDVPEFREGRSQVAALEDRLQRRVEGRLGEALKANNGSEVASLAGLLLAVGRYASLESAYVASRAPLLTAMWDEAAAMLASSSSAPAAGEAAGGAAAAVSGPAGGASAGGLGGGWLLLLYNNLASLFEEDAAWLAGCLPEQRRQLLLALVAAAFDKLNRHIAPKLQGLTNTRLLGSVMGDVQQAARRLRELLATITATPPLPAAAAAAAAAGDSSGTPTAADGAGSGAAAAAAAEAAAAAADSSTLHVLKLLLDPLELQVSRYVQLEQPACAAQLNAPLPVPTSSRAAAGLHQHQQQEQRQEDEEGELDAEVASKLDAAAALAFGALAGVLERCLLLTGGTELPALQKSLDKQLATYLQRLLAAVGIISARHAKLAASNPGAADVSGLLQLVVLARNISARLSGLETQLRSAITTAIPRLQQVAASGLPPPHMQQHHHQHGAPGQQQQQQQQHATSLGGLTAATAAAAAELLPLRMAAFPAKLAPLEQLRAAAGSSRFMSLPAANAAGAALVEAVANAVYEALTAPVVAALATLPGLREWSAAAPGQAGAIMTGAGASVPSFSAYPLPAVTAVGEYLMGLPQQLEVLLAAGSSASVAAAAAAAAAGEGGEQQQQAAADADEGGDDDELAAEWLDKVVRGAGDLYAAMVRRIPALSPAGAAQLAADAEYVANVMAALAVPPPPELLTAQLAAGAPPGDFARLAAGEGLDPKMLRAVAAMRGLNWSPADVQQAGGSTAAAPASEGAGATPSAEPA